MMQLTHFAPATNLLWKYLESIEVDPEPLYLRSGIDPAVLSDPAARISINCIEQLWEEVSRVITDPCFGVKMAEFWHPSQIGALGYAWLVSSSLRKALKRVVRYIHVVTEDMNLELADTPTGLCLVLDLEGSVFRLPYQHDLVVAVAMRMCRFNLGEDLVPTKLTLAHPEPVCAQALQDYFRCDIEFDADRTSITISREEADRTLSTANRQIALLHDELLMKYLVEIKKGNIVDQVRSIILENLPDGQVTDKMVASELNLSERSMQRRLQEHSTTFRKLLDNVREMVAKQYIRNPVNRMSDIAFLLGFSEQSAFSRAFKKWTGMTPLQYRETASM